VDFELIDVLDADQAVYARGAYADFVLVEANVAGESVAGYAYKNALGVLPAPLLELVPEAVPPKPLYLPDCAPGVYDAATHTLTLANDRDGFYDTLSSAIQLESPLTVEIDGLAVRDASYGSIKLLGIPARGETWWKGISRLDIAHSHGRYVLGIRDGSAPDFVAAIDLPLDTNQPLQLKFDQTEGKSFVVLDGQGQEIERVDLAQLPGVDLPGGLFPEGDLYIGTSISPHSTLAITGLKVGVVPDGRWDPNAVIGPGLAELASKHNLTIGTEFAVGKMIDPRYCRAMKRDFNVAVLSEFMWNSIWLGPGEYDFATLDHAVDYAMQNGWRLRASHLVWGALEVHAIPDWILNGQFTRDEYIQILEEHVKTMVGRYKGRVQEWSIANEYPSRFFWDGDFWNEKIGPEYVEMAFRWAKEADPESILIFNDSNNESPRDRDTTRTIDKMYEMVRDLKAKGVPIDIVGMQMHLLLKWHSLTPPTKEDVIATMRKFADLGVRIQITELDVSLTRRRGTQAEQWAFQAQLYREMMEACLESGVCDSFTTWGVSDSTSWITCEDPWCQLKEPNADPLMFDKEFRPKPAYWAVREVLSK